MLVALLGMTFNTGKHEKPFWGANIYLPRRLDSTSVFKAPLREVFWVWWLCREFPFQWTHCIHICDQEKHRNLSGEGCDLMKGCLREDFFIPAEKVKSIEALHGSAHSQEWLACPSLPVGRPGKTNTSFFARINKQWNSLEVDRNWATFCYSYGRALVRTRICHPEVREFPRSCTGLCTSWQCLGRAVQGAQNLHCLLLKYLLSVAFPWTVCKCTQAFLWRTLQFLSWLRLWNE